MTDKFLERTVRNNYVYIDLLIISSTMFINIINANHFNKVAFIFESLFMLLSFMLSTAVHYDDFDNKKTIWKSYCLNVLNMAYISIFFITMIINIFY